MKFPPPAAAMLVRQEFRIFAAAGGALIRRRKVDAGDRVISYGGRMIPLLVVMIVVAMIELAVVELFVPWAWLHWTLLIAGGYGFFWVAGFGSSAYTRPHSVNATELRLRMTVYADVAVPVDAVSKIGGSLGSHDKSVEVADDVLAISVLGLTNLIVHLKEPVEVDLRRLGRHSVHAVRFFADDPRKAADEIRELAGIDGPRRSA